MLKETNPHVLTHSSLISDSFRPYLPARIHECRLGDGGPGPFRFPRRPPIERKKGYSLPAPNRILSDLRPAALGSQRLPWKPRRTGWGASGRIQSFGAADSPLPRYTLRCRFSHPGRPFLPALRPRTRQYPPSRCPDHRGRCRDHRFPALDSRRRNHLAEPGSPQRPPDSGRLASRRGARKNSL